MIIRISTSRSKKNELIKGEALATSLGNASSGGLSESESSNCQLGDLKNSDVISHGADNDGDSVSAWIRRAYCFWPRCLMMRDRDRGGLFTLDETSLLSTVFAKVESVLLARNLNSLITRWM